MISRIIMILVTALILLPTHVFAISVPGISDPYLSGMPNGSTASNGDSAPSQSPVLVTGIDLSLGGILGFSAFGDVGNCPGCFSGTPDGSGFFPHATGAENGISNIIAPVNSLLGVFLDVNQPDTSLAPSTLDFSIIGLSFSTLSPELKQLFFIGDGLTGTGSGTMQTFSIPTGATRLFLGTMDGFGWYNNVGSFEVAITHTTPTSVPEPASFLLLGSGLVGLLGLMEFRRKRLLNNAELLK